MSQIATHNNTAIGSLRINNSVIEIFDGTCWSNVKDTIYPSKPQQSVESLCKVHPGLEELKKELDKAQEKFDVYLALVRSNE